MDETSWQPAPYHTYHTTLSPLKIMHSGIVMQSGAQHPVPTPGEEVILGMDPAVQPECTSADRRDRRTAEP